MNRLTMERIDAALEGTLDSSAFEELQQELKRDPEAFEHFCRQAELHGRLEWELKPPAVEGSSVAGVPSAVPARRLRPVLPWIAAAAVVILGLGAGMLWNRGGKPGVAPEHEASADRTQYFARLTLSDGARWNDADRSVGQWLPAGTLDLAAGTAEVTFDSGAVVAIEGPARLDIQSPNRSMLLDGKASVNLPAPASAFVLETPAGQLWRGRSRFGVAVDSGGHTEIHVADGEINLDPKQGDVASLRLSKSKAVRMTVAGGTREPLQYSPSDFQNVAAPDIALLPKDFLHWNFDHVQGDGTGFRESGLHPKDSPSFPARPVALGSETHPSLVAGRFGNAVKLDGREGVLVTDFPGYADDQPRTVSFWVLIPPDTPDTFAYSIVSWGALDKRGGGKWQIGWNAARDNSGKVGAIRTEVDKGFNVGSTDLRDGRWHHVTCVFPGGRNATTAHVRHYIDGKLESSTAVQERVIDTITGTPGSFPLTIGHRIEQGDFFLSFRGCLDELYLFPVALTPGQIEELYFENRPPVIR